MKLLGAKVIGVGGERGTLRNAINEALRDWASHIDNTHYVIGSAVGPHPFPKIVRDFHAVIGEEAREQILKAEGRLPAAVFACVGGGSNAIGIFHHFRGDNEVQLIGVEAGGRNFAEGEHSSTLSKGSPGILHGSLSYLLHTEEGQVSPVHSVSAGLDYPGVGPEHSYLKDSKRATYASVNDQEALEGLKELSQTEGIIAALETAHAVAFARKWAKENRRKDKVIIVNLSGRGDKDMAEIRRFSNH